jgi:hypothetical protein
MRQRVLLVAAELDLRARFARELQSSGYAGREGPFSDSSSGARTEPRRLGDGTGVTRHRAENDRGRGGIGRDRSLASLASRNR